MIGLRCLVALRLVARGLCRRWALTGVLLLLFPAAAQGEVIVDWVTVGNPGNLPDPQPHLEGTVHFGAVDYVYRIAKYEVTNAQYAQFLNAVAATDTYELYDEWMGDQWLDIGGISRSGEPGSYVYSTRPNRANRPVGFVTFFDALRFANWLHNGQRRGAQDATTTEDGAYTLNGFMGGDIDVEENLRRNPGARVWIPNEDKWHKAAYHKNDGPTGNYWKYATASDDPPRNDLLDPDPGNNANFYRWDSVVGWRLTLGAPYWSTEVGEFENSASAYGTFDQLGNVWEWTDTPYFYFRHLRGGAWGETWPGDESAFSDVIGGESNIGFRVAAQVPEPGTLILLGSAALVILVHAAWRLLASRGSVRAS